MTNEEALDYFKQDVENLKEMSSQYLFSSMDIDIDLAAINALERQIPETPVQDPKTTKWYCRQCGTWIAEHQHYCDKCGQAIDWRCLDVQGS